jgi:hypothetical protein
MVFGCSGVMVFGCSGVMVFMCYGVRVKSDSKLETRNSKPETPNSKLQTRNSKLQTRNSKLQTRNSKLQTRNSKPETLPQASGSMAMIRRGAPLPPLMRMGRASTKAPVGGSLSRLATFSKAGISALKRMRWLSKRLDCP